MESESSKTSWIDKTTLGISNTYIVLGLVVIVLLGVGLGLGLGLGLSGNDHNPSVTVSTSPDVSQGGEGLLGEMQIISTDLSGRLVNTIDDDIKTCPFATEIQQSEWYIPSNSLVCSDVPIHFSEDTKSHHFKGIYYTDETPDKPYYVFVPRGMDDMKVEMENVSGTFYSGYLIFEQDMWTTGFSGDAPITNPEQEVEKMVQNLNQAVLLMGEEAALPGTECNPEFSFNVKTPVLNRMNIKNTHLLQTVSGKDLRGVFRLAFDHVDYEYKLNGVKQTVRVVLSSCNGEMGDKMIDIDGTFKWYDIKTEQFTSVRTDTVLSFWNQPRSEEKHDEHHDEQDQKFHDAIVPAFKDRRLGMPIAIGSTGFDFSTLNQQDVSLTVNLLIDGFVSFRGASQMTEEFLLQNPKEQIIRFDIPDLSLKSLINVA